ncbi:hypothetical protein HAX54_008462 [Datura stramonium]|uniref:Uncharacterized protein n=1 Tax=Datura stramonium TaxID=4076 RepID=A0ABS8TD78_DATST|nr:hypothetical protein [Datura stramonium]
MGFHLDQPAIPFAVVRQMRVFLRALLSSEKNNNFDFDDLPQPCLCYFVEYISKVYSGPDRSGLKENFEKYGHPDGRQGFLNGIALSVFCFDFNGSSGGILIWILEAFILLPMLLRCLSIKSIKAWWK